MDILGTLQFTVTAPGVPSAPSGVYRLLFNSGVPFSLAAGATKDIAVDVIRPTGIAVQPDSGTLTCWGEAVNKGAIVNSIGPSLLRITLPESFPVGPAQFDVELRNWVE